MLYLILSCGYGHLCLSLQFHLPSSLPCCRRLASADCFTLNLLPVAIWVWSRRGTHRKLKDRYGIYSLSSFPAGLPVLSSFHPMATILVGWSSPTARVRTLWFPVPPLSHWLSPHDHNVNIGLHHLLQVPLHPTKTFVNQPFIKLPLITPFEIWMCHLFSAAKLMIYKGTVNGTQEITTGTITGTMWSAYTNVGRIYVC